MLSGALFTEIRSDLFRVLTGPNARFYVDAIDSLATEIQSSAAGISRQEAVAAVLEVLEQHASFEREEDVEIPGEDLSSPSGQAHYILNRLTRAGWFSEPRRPDYQRILRMEPAGEVLLEALRKIAHPEAATFTDKLQIVCAMLINPETFSDNPWGDLEGCLANTKLGLQELRGMQKSVERMTRRQLQSASLRENLALLYDEFSEAIGHSCYRELVRVRLPIRVRQAQRRLEDLERDESILSRMESEVHRREPTADYASARAKVRLRLRELFDLLDAIVPQAEEMDRQTAEFARRSFARFRYLREVGSARREQVQEIFEWINESFAGKRLTDLEADLPPLLVGEAGLIGGRESLYPKVRRRQAGEIDPVGEDPDESDLEAALLDMEANLRDSLNVIRANQFVAGLDWPRGGVLSSSELPVRTDDDVADLAALLLHAESSDALYRITTAREQSKDGDIPADAKAGYMIERFELRKP